MSGCDAFRARLERELAGRVGADEMRALAWHEHLLGCAACRELLEAEQALEELLASLPTPQLSPAVAQRVLARLRGLRTADRTAQELRLDALLELDVAAPPIDLVHGVLAGLSGERASTQTFAARSAGDPEHALDRLLELDLATPPAGLSTRVLAGLAARRGALQGARLLVAVSPPSATLLRARRLTSWALPIAAGVLVALGGWALWPEADDGGPQPDELVALVEPEPEMLAALDVLEEWDLLMDMEEDLDLLFSTLEPADELLLEFQDEGDGEPGLPAPGQAPDAAPALPPSPETNRSTNRDSKG